LADTEFFPLSGSAFTHISAITIRPVILLR
jgi:hypothetical protein